MSREVRTVQTVDFPSYLSLDLLDQWAQTIPSFSDTNTERPEWHPTRVIPLDLRPAGFGQVLIKDESDPASNPTRTAKDRPAWEVAATMRDLAIGLLNDHAQGFLTKGEITKMLSPRFTIVTAGNAGGAFAYRFAEHNLPPPHIILDTYFPDHQPEIFGKILQTRSHISLVDLSTELSPQELLDVSSNHHGIDLTSNHALEPSSNFYDWHVHEVFNLNPDIIFVPYGSGHLAENYWVWQNRTRTNESRNNRDPRLTVDAARVRQMHVLAAEPNPESLVADKLASRFKPFTTLSALDVQSLVRLQVTGDRSNIYRISDDRIVQAHALLQAQGIDAEPSAAAGMALYLEQWEEHRIPDTAKVVIVNTGSGLWTANGTATVPC